MAKRVLTRQEVCRRMHISPTLLRQMFREHAGVLGPLGSEGIALPTVEKLAQLLELRSRGGSRDRVKVAAEGSVALEAPSEESLLQAELRAIAVSLTEAEERRASDRDRLLMALIRTQQEITQLRYDLCEHVSRRGRRAGLLRRLMGR